MRDLKAESSLIGDDAIRAFVELCLAKSPEYIFGDCPSSSSGKYHPEDELDGYGTITHTKRVVWVVRQLCKGPEKDLAIAAAIIHDLRKQGVEKSGRTVNNHPDLAASLVYEVAVEHPGVLDDDSVEALYHAVGYHYGPWGSGAWACSDGFYGEVDYLSKVVHAADFLASRKEIGSRIAITD